MRVALAVLGAMSLAFPACPAASVLPKPGVEDPRIQSVDYDARQVVTLRVALGYALTIEFSPDERIQNVAVGNSNVWQVTPNKSADHLFIKPTQAASDTDMTVITDARSYNFELKTLPAPDPSMPFMVRVLYPVASTLPEVASRSETSTYHFIGDKALHPLEMSDDGFVTAIIWAPKTPIPAVYVLDRAGREALVNGAMRNGRFMVDQIADQFIFRLGAQEERAIRRVTPVRKK